MIAFHTFDADTNSPCYGSATGFVQKKARFSEPPNHYEFFHRLGAAILSLKDWIFTYHATVPSSYLPNLLDDLDVM